MEDTKPLGRGGLDYLLKVIFSLKPIRVIKERSNLVVIINITAAAAYEYRTHQPSPYIKMMCVNGSMKCT